MKALTQTLLLSFTLLASIFSLASLPSYSAPPEVPASARTWLEREQLQNDFFEVASGTENGRSDIGTDFQASSHKIFELPYFDVPVGSLQIVDSGFGNPELRQQILFEIDGVKYFRFFVHPESEALLEFMREHFSRKGAYLATPKRRQLAWNG